MVHNDKSMMKFVDDEFRLANITVDKILGNQVDNWSKFTTTVTMSSMKFAVEWKRRKNKGFLLIKGQSFTLIKMFCGGLSN